MFIKKICKISILFFCLFFTSCATLVKYNSLKPARLSDYEITSVAVLPYSYENSSSSSLTTKSPQAIASMEKIYSFVSEEILKEENLSLINYDIFFRENSSAEVLTTSLEVSNSHSLENPRSNSFLPDCYITFSLAKFFVYENFYLSDGKSLSSLDSSVKYFYNIDEYGRSLPLPQYVFESSNTSTSSVIFSDDTTASRHVDMEFSYSIVQTATKKVLQMETFVISSNSEEFPVGKALPFALDIIENELKAYSKQIVNNFRPYKVLKSHALIDSSKNANMKKALKFAAKSDSKSLELARELYFAEYENSGNFDAAYNYSLVSLALGKIDDAFLVMNEVCEQSNQFLYKNLLLEIIEERKNSKDISPKPF